MTRGWQIAGSVSGDLSSVDVQGLARDEGGPLEVEDPLDDVVDRSEPAERVQSGQAVVRGEVVLRGP